MWYFRGKQYPANRKYIYWHSLLPRVLDWAAWWARDGARVAARRQVVGSACLRVMLWAGDSLPKPHGKHSASWGVRFVCLSNYLWLPQLHTSLEGMLYFRYKMGFQGKKKTRILSHRSCGLMSSCGRESPKLLICSFTGYDICVQ